ncbi:MAG: VWA domain-containing protein [Candidatus Hatepunaea meridiana]|nr:VWA domain-containing protein [Candidatus Hatepunaea meridiana]
MNCNLDKTYRSIITLLLTVLLTVIVYLLAGCRGGEQPSDMDTTAYSVTKQPVAKLEMESAENAQPPIEEKIVLNREQRFAIASEKRKQIAERTKMHGNYGSSGSALKSEGMAASTAGDASSSMKVGEQNCGNKNNKTRDLTDSDLEAVLSESSIKLSECRVSPKKINAISGKGASCYSDCYAPIPQPCFHTEEYDRIYDNEFKSVINDPVSTFSIDVDVASYSNVRRFINQGTLPPKDAVRIEEMINYFSYDYPDPDKKHPFSITTEISTCPWNKSNRLAHIGLQGKRISTDEFPPSNLVFLIDVSGSMRNNNKLPLLKQSFRMLVKQLRKIDHVAIVVYSGSAREVLPSTQGNRKDMILSAINGLYAGGSTAGGAGIQLAYNIAKENFIRKGNNRVILATDGDFNIGVSSDSELVRIIEEKRKMGIFLTVLGFGTGNYKDAKMEQIADKGNGNYAYIDNIHEGKKVLVSEIGGTLLTIAKDVKIQIEFNPTNVKAYRLLGYENRKLAREDFNNDTKDAGEMGAGHSVTALYEIVPTGADLPMPEVDELKYQRTEVSPDAVESDEMMTVKLRYKPPREDISKLIVIPVIDNDIALSETSDNFRFSASIAQFGMLLRDSEFKGDVDFESTVKLARSARGEDKNGYRAEFIRLVEMCEVFN